MQLTAGGRQRAAAASLSLQLYISYDRTALNPALATALGRLRHHSGGGVRPRAAEVVVGLDRVVASEIEVSNMLVNMICSG